MPPGSTSAFLATPCGGIAPDGSQWAACRPGFFLPVRVFSRLFRRLFLEKLLTAHGAGHLRFFNDLAQLPDHDAFAAVLARLRNTDWAAISSSRLIAFDGQTVTFKWKDYRAKPRDRQKIMTLDVSEFIRRFLIHVLPQRFHRIRHYGLFANGGRRENLARARQLFNVETP